jgi:hypothetical protein
VNVAGPTPASNLEHLSVVQIRELEGSIWRRFSGAADLGYRERLRSYHRPQLVLQEVIAGGLHHEYRLAKVAA